LKRGSTRFWLCANTALSFVSVYASAREQKRSVATAKNSEYNPPRAVVELYGGPSSRSSSTNDGQPLELLYYAFDWAGPDLPHVMEVGCAAPKDGSPGRVVETTLAASSL
jgi:hypothetical protein